jgi:hypothetical protein
VKQNVFSCFSVYSVEILCNLLHDTSIFHSDEVRRQLNHCVRDGLVRLVKRMGFKGSKIGIEQEGYCLPQNTVCLFHVFFSSLSLDLVPLQLQVLLLLCV